MARSAQKAPVNSEVNAYNAAFDQLGLGWHWDDDVLRQFAAIPGEKERIAEYLRRHHPHLLTAYPVDFLASAITEAKARAVADAR